ncbi:2-oxoglutarate-Fe(II)-dependent oxygenase superfamily protein [Motilibacter rhizosphaerae]|uniref:2-oxoglutarate-Fe(II)-dependent oxygenase superfamily protein n=1 Tax=Motilibacter rhizosphaerae TaxID=598652 RepID=A0A4Q7NPE2_9ACTN|nr:alpha-ketoglutarate-dependent dioxygenase AlkB [Motilibacter rhizosphaerae]RZS87131.1 2-oxoglutarate-Fe(II)-dependent oxygenase superfamily protein [Motilibacter rhizosphaerae]
MIEAVGLQGSLFDEGAVRPDRAFTGLRRIALDERSWVDSCPSWLGGADALFEELLGTGRFTRRTVRVWDNEVLEPRMTAGFDVEVDSRGAGAAPAALRDVAAAVSERYGVTFDRIWVNLYRDGRDSVAWHGDRNRHSHRDPLVVTVSLGATRRFLLRPRGGRTALELHPTGGDLLVMGGACQHEWEHTVPKEAAVTAPRMSVTLRHTAHLDRPGERAELAGRGRTW